MNDSQRAKILIVDDIAENIHILMTLLKENYAIVAATNGEEALRLAAVQPQPEIILLDIMMPGMSGHEVCRHLKKDPQTRDIPVIFVSALGEEKDETEGLELGAADYIRKPISPPIVKARIKNHLALFRARKELKEENLALIEAARLKEDIERITRHDLKAPLNGIIGFPHILLEDDNLTTDQKKLLHNILSAGYTMLDTINMSLDLYRMEEGSYELQAVEVDLVKTLARINDEMNLGASNILRIKNIVKGKETEAEPFRVQGENLLCYSMLANLIKNALEASPPKQPITVSLERTAASQGLIRVHNHGSVPEEIRENFFDKYVTRGKRGGTGLGTYSSALIVKTQGGRIDLDTSVAGETVVAIRLPLAE